MNKFELLSDEQIRKIFTESSSYNEIQRRCGYKAHSSRNKIINQIAKEKNIILFSSFLKDKDITGQTFNLLTAISKNEQVSKEKEREYWNCQCQCGKSCTVSSYSLKEGLIKSCGCLNEPDYTNQIFNNIKVIRKNQELSGKGQGQFWIAECLLCHKVFDISTGRLKEGQKSCGCLNKAPDLKDQVFGSLTVIEKLHTDSHRNMLWLCQCKCGEQIITTTSNLLSGKKEDCGCSHKTWEYKIKKIKNKTGKIYGFLKPLEIDRDSTEKKEKTYWKCLCMNCNTIISVSSSNLEKGQISCGCIKSIGEKFISQLLKQYKIPFQKQVSFPDLVGDAKKLRFDFGIYNNRNELLLLIEYNGIQHYSAVDFFGGQEQLEKQQRYDLLKEEYCRKNKIPLVIFSSIEEIDINKIRGVIS